MQCGSLCARSFLTCERCIADCFYCSFLYVQMLSLGLVSVCKDKFSLFSVCTCVHLFLSVSSCLRVIMHSIALPTDRHGCVHRRHTHRTRIVPAHLTCVMSHSERDILLLFLIGQFPFSATADHIGQDLHLQRHVT